MKTRFQSTAIAGLLMILAAAVPVGADPAAKPAARQDDKTPKKPKKPRVWVTISKETTYITEPLRKDGYVDYIAALNQRASEGVTPENNASVLLWRAMGPAEIAETVRPRFFKMLGIPPLPELGDYYLPLEQYAKQANSGRTPEEAENAEETSDKLWKELDRAQRGPWSKKDCPTVAGWLAANEKKLALIVEATSRPRRYDPMIAADGPELVIAVLLPGVQGQRDVARALAARSMLRLGQGKTDEAWADLLACHRLARLAGQGPTLIEALVAITIDGIACRSDQAFLQHAKLTAAQARKMQSDLAGLPPMPKMADKVVLAERFMYLDAVAMIARDGIDKFSRLDDPDDQSGSIAKKLMSLATQATIDWDLVLRMGNSWFDRIVAAFRKPTRAERNKAMAEIEEELKKSAAEAKDPASLALSFLGNPRQTLSTRMGKVFVALLVPAVTAAASAEDRGTMYFDVTRLGFALAAYRAEHGSYPAKLADLVPKYVTAVPEDIFSTDPLHYRRQGDGYVLFSVGANRKDDGGKGYNDRDLENRPEEDWDDLAVRVPAPKKEKQKK